MLTEEQDPPIILFTGYLGMSRIGTDALE